MPLSFGSELTRSGAPLVYLTLLLLPVELPPREKDRHAHATKHHEDHSSHCKDHRKSRSPASAKAIADATW